MPPVPVTTSTRGDLVLVLLEDPRRQTDGVRERASGNAVLDPDVRQRHPPEATRATAPLRLEHDRRRHEVVLRRALADRQLHGDEGTPEVGCRQRGVLRRRAARVRERRDPEHEGRDDRRAPGPRQPASGAPRAELELAPMRLERRRAQEGRQRAELGREGRAVRAPGEVAREEPAADVVERAVELERDARPGAVALAPGRGRETAPAIRARRADGEGRRAGRAPCRGRRAPRRAGTRRPSS